MRRHFNLLGSSRLILSTFFTFPLWLFIAVQKVTQKKSGIGSGCALLPFFFFFIEVFIVIYPLITYLPQLVESSMVLYTLSVCVYILVEILGSPLLFFVFLFLNRTFRPCCLYHCSVLAYRRSFRVKCVIWPCLM